VKLPLLATSIRFAFDHAITAGQPHRIILVATSTHLAEPAAQSRSSSRRNPIVLWHLLSLDAPTVAALWTWFIARANHVGLSASPILAMAVAVWMLYAADRLLDTRSIQPEHELEERHYFHRLNSRAFVVGIVLAALLLAALLPHLAAASLRLYLILGAMLFAYFILIHASAHTRRLPKELAVGVFFSAAIFIPTVSRLPALRSVLLPAAVLFAVLCSLNCLFIYAWEHPRSLSYTHPATRAALSVLPTIAVIELLAALALSLTSPALPWQVPGACALSASLLLLLHRSRHRFTEITLRAAADLCLLTPLLFLPLLNR
jgi:hypothetical protein